VEVEYECVADVEEQAVEWLWRYRVPLGALTMVAGEPGVGKSTLTADWAARVSRGAAWPDGSPGAPGDVVLVGAEDSVSRTVKPRLREAGADLERCWVLGDIRNSERVYPLTLKRIGVIEEFLKGLVCPRLLVIDPIASYVDETVNPHADAQVRVMLRPLVELVERWQMAGVYVTHLNKSEEKKSAINRAGGSIAWVGACRASYVIAKKGGKRVMAPLKCNLASELETVSYELAQTGTDAIARVKWDMQAEGVSADELVVARS
jgi:RecA-family ATPase